MVLICISQRLQSLQQWGTESNTWGKWSHTCKESPGTWSTLQRIKIIWLLWQQMKSKIFCALRTTVTPQFIWVAPSRSLGRKQACNTSGWSLILRVGFSLRMPRPWRWVGASHLMESSETFQLIALLAHTLGRSAIQTLVTVVFAPRNPDRHWSGWSNLNQSQGKLINRVSNVWHMIFTTSSENIDRDTCGPERRVRQGVTTEDQEPLNHPRSEKWQDKPQVGRGVWSGETVGTSKSFSVYLDIFWWYDQFYITSTLKGLIKHYHDHMFHRQTNR